MEEVLPLANELDPQKADIPRWFLDRIGEQGYFGITISTEFGGLGLGVFEYCMIAEELARAWMSVASIIARAQGMGTQFADPERRAHLLSLSARGQWIGAAALSEPEAGSDLANVQTRAVKSGDDYVVTGTKRWTGNAKAADFIQLLCRVADPQPGEARSAGLATLIVEKERDSFPAGLSGEEIDKIGYHGFSTWNLTFDGLRVPAAGRPAARSGAPFGPPRPGSTWPGCTRPRGPSASRGRRSRTASPTPRSGSSSSTPSATSRPCASSWPRWRRAWSRRGPSTGRWPTSSTRASPASARPPW